MRTIEKIVAENMMKNHQIKIKKGLKGTQLVLETRELKRNLNFLKHKKVFLVDDSLREVWDNEADDAAWDKY